MRIEEIMKSGVATCPEDATGTHAAQIMWDHACGIVPVVHRETRRLVGMITDRDLCMASLSQGRALHDVSVASCMSRDVHVAQPRQDAADVHETMRRFHVRRVPVVDNDWRVVGIVSIDDLAMHATPKDVAMTLAAVAGQPSAIVQR